MTLRNLLITLLLLLVTLHLSAQISLGEGHFTDYNSPKEYYIGGMTVSGVKYLDGNVLIMLSGLTVGDKIKVPGDKISQAIRKTKLFCRTQIAISDACCRRKEI